MQVELDESEASLAAANKALKTATTESDKNKTAFENEAKASFNSLVRGSLTKELAAVNIPAKALDRIVNSFINDEKNKIIVTDEDGSRVAKVGDKSLSDFIKDWATGDEGKTLISAKSNNGGGAPGGEGKLDNDALSKIENPAARLQAINSQTAAE